MPFRLAYVSALVDGVSREEIDAIVQHSAESNARRGVTGILALDGTRVCQILEGPEEAVEALFETIGRDPRHRDVVEIDRRRIDRPHFGRWGMMRRRMIDVVTLALTIP